MATKILDMHEIERQRMLDILKQQDEALRQGTAAGSIYGGLLGGTMTTGTSITWDSTYLEPQQGWVQHVETEREVIRTKTPAVSTDDDFCEDNTKE